VWSCGVFVYQAEPINVKEFLNAMHQIQDRHGSVGGTS
jgi:hypothetical protein